MKFTPSKLLLLICLALLPGPGNWATAGPNATAGPGHDQTPDLPYTLEQPALRIKLPDKLNEVSGLGWAGKHRIACVQDEKGNLYEFNLKKREARKLFEYEDKGDYEAVEIVGSTAWALESNGNLHAVIGYQSTSPHKQNYKSELPKGSEAEGLAWDPSSERLLIALKSGEGLDRQRAIYTFDPVSRRYSEEPHLTVDEKALARWLHDNDMRKGDDAGDIDFRPSGIAVHPVSAEIYLISTTARLLLVLDPEGRFRHAADLDREDHRQPEGICFAPNGDLWIANEGRKKSSRLLKYNYSPPADSGNSKSPVH